jgi:hypothetical protein
MPLESGDSRRVVGHNIEEMIASGHPRKQAIAASLSNARKTGHGHVPPPPKKYCDTSGKKLPHPLLAALKRHIEYKRYCKECGCG